MKVKVKNKQEIFKKSIFTINEYTLEEETPEGNTAEYKRVCLDRGNGAFIIPYDKEKNSVVMIRQSRIGLIADGITESTLEFPAGMIDEGEDPIQSASRELKEETGLVANNVQQLYKTPLYTSCGGSNEKTYCFIAEVDSSQTEKYGADLGENEYIETEIIPIDELFDIALTNQEINKANTLICIMLFRDYLAKK